jgi:hypothetical protein
MGKIIIIMIYYKGAHIFSTPLHATLICIEFRYDITDNLQRLI